MRYKNQLKNVGPVPITCNLIRSSLPESECVLAVLIIMNHDDHRLCIICEYSKFDSSNKIRRAILRILHITSLCVVHCRFFLYVFYIFELPNSIQSFNLKPVCLFVVGIPASSVEWKCEKNRQVVLVINNDQFLGQKSGRISMIFNRINSLNIFLHRLWGCAQHGAERIDAFIIKHAHFCETGGPM